MNYIFPLEKINKNYNIGNKAKNLKILKEAGFTIPPSFSIPSEIYKNIFQKSLENFNYMPLDEKEKRLPEIRETILKYKFTGEFSEDLKKIYSSITGFAVRSSCSDEDGINYSFAGLYKSLLTVNHDSLPEAIKDVWASLWNIEAFSYRKEKNISREPLMAVLIQEQIIPIFSGVMFTKNPENDENEIVINWTEGLGDKLVSGENIPYSIRLKVDKKNLSSNIISQEGEMKEELLHNLIKNAVEIENLFQCPQDIEWAYDGTLYILQSRPITCNYRIKWSRNIVKDSFTESLTNMSASFYSEYLSKRLVAFYDEMRIVNPAPLILEYKGLLYVNEVKCNNLGDELCKNFYYHINKLWFYLNSLPMELKAHYEKINYFIKLQEENLSELELWDIFIEIKDYLYSKDPPFTIGYLHDILNYYYRILLPPELHEYEDYFYMLKPLSGDTEVYTFHRDLIALSKESDDEKKVKEFIEKYGHWTEIPVELAGKRYREEPYSLIRVIKNLKTQNKDEINREEEVNKKLEEIKKIKKKYENSIKRMDMVNLFDSLLNWIIYVKDQREVTRKYTLLITDKMRKILLALGDKLKERGFLEEKEDIFFLRLSEIEILVKLDKYEHLWLNYIKTLKKEWDYIRKNKYPDEFTGNIPRPLIKTEVPIKEGEEIKGIKLNGGIITGYGRVIKEPEKIDEVKEGEILIVKNCEPHWSILFPIIGGFISETGGVLSHGAILAREYNIPAVSGIENITSMVKTGQLITLNGDLGYIKIKNNQS